ncbi:glycoside hydrolase family 92 protein [Xylariales sp. PMI_506]|nr:glycoside hydrolase family 92 protein [Xylariales sp. PMI_506]
MAKAVADVDNKGENAAGFVSDSSLITGFSHLHDSGTGGSPSLGNFPLFVHPGCPSNDYNLCKFDKKFRAAERVDNSVEARPGYFAIKLNNSIHVEMTAAKHTALYRFNVSPTPRIGSDNLEAVMNSPLLLLDLTDIASNRRGGYAEVDPESGRIWGNGTFIPSFGKGTYSAYFCADFTGADIRKSGTFQRGTADESVKAIGKDPATGSLARGSSGAWIHFERATNDQILARVGLSFISIDQACSNAESEIPDFDFDAVVAASERAWTDKLSVIEVDGAGVDKNLQTTFWSGLYRTFLSPQDYTGENPLWNSTEPYFDSFYCIWDSFRAQHPLLSIVDPKEQARMVRALIDIYKHEGKLPDCRMSFSPGFTQGGSNADVVLADALLKNVTDGIDWKLAYEAVISDAEELPADWSVRGRGGIADWIQYGYIPVDETVEGVGPRSRSISRTVEYAYDDFSIALMAKKLGNSIDANKYLQRSQNWKNLYNPDQGDMAQGADGEVPLSPFRGFLQPRLQNGSFTSQSTRLCSPVYEQHRCYFDTSHATYEGSPWLYTFYVPHDMASLVETLGGRDAFTSRLDYFHESGIAYMGNEQSFLPTFQFHYAGRPALSTRWVHRYIPAQFNSSINGIPGNDDCAMGAFTTFAFLGFFPVAGQDVYLLTTPLFREVRIATPAGGGHAVIRCVGFDPTYDAIYIQSARLNGKPYTKNWITHDFFLRGGLLELVLGKTESDWGTRDEDLPPSLSTSERYQ